ncbi:MAG: hypothetical protein KDH19_17975 [Geminicoccaceae bacterium]|nr:hypothetical protein [Geminicoccaceae bacterium]
MPLALNVTANSLRLAANGTGAVATIASAPPQTQLLVTDLFDAVVTENDENIIVGSG